MWFAVDQVGGARYRPSDPTKPDPSEPLRTAMTRHVKVAEAKTHLSELLVKVQRGEEFVITRGSEPVARLVPVDELAHRRALIGAIRMERNRYKPVSQAEIRDWKHEDHTH
jgi:prevent-host-death family protein